MNVRTHFCIFTASLAFSMPAWGQEEKSAGDTIYAPAIVVTGELIDRPLEKSGTSVEIFDAQALEERAGLNSLRDIIEQTPNVSGLIGTVQAPTIRGVDGTGASIGGNAFLAGSRQRLTYQIDGRPANFSEVAYGNLNIWDLERIEVLRGPQSSLVGRNSIAGTVVVETKDPAFEVEAAGQAATGNYGQRRVSGMVNAPLDNNIAAFRLSADWSQIDSSVKYQPFPGIDDPGEKQSLNLRGKALIFPNFGDSTELLLGFTHHMNQAMTAENVVRPFKERVSDFPQNPVHTLITNSVSAEFTTSLTDTLTLEVNSVFTDFGFDRDATPRGGPANQEVRELVIEPRVSYSDSSGYSGVAGIYYYDSEQNEELIFGARNVFDDRTETMAAYIEGIIPLNDSLDLSGGLRFENEERKRIGGDAGPVLDFFLDETYSAFLPKAGLNWAPTEGVNWGVQVSRGFNAGGGGVSFPTAPGTPFGVYSFGSEYVWNYEIYGRQTFAGGKVRTTQNVFFSDFEDMQLQVDVNPANPIEGLFTVENIDQVRTYGAEFGLSAAVDDTLTLNGGVGLLWTDIVKDPTFNLEGNELQTAPNITANIGMIWKDENWRASASGRYSDSYFTNTRNSAIGKVDPFFTADAALSYTFGGAEIFGEVNNVFNSEKPIARYAPNFLTAPSDRAVLQQPRTFLVGVKVQY